MEVRIENLKRNKCVIDNITLLECCECKKFKDLNSYELKTYTNRKRETYSIPRAQCKICRGNESKLYHRMARKKLNYELAMSEINRLNLLNKDLNLKLKRHILRLAKNSARSHNREFNLELEDIVIPKKCPLLNKEFDLNSFKYAYSVDRKDNLKGYIKGNIRIVSRLANIMKSNATNEELIEFSKNIKQYIEDIV